LSTKKSLRFVRFLKTTYGHRCEKRDFTHAAMQRLSCSEEVAETMYNFYSVFKGQSSYGTRSEEKSSSNRVEICSLAAFFVAQTYRQCVSTSTEFLCTDAFPKAEASSNSTPRKKKAKSPVTSPSSPASPRLISSLSTMPSTSQLHHVKKWLPQLLSTIAEEETISQRDFDALDIIFEGGYDFSKRAKQLSSVCNLYGRRRHRLLEGKLREDAKCKDDGERSKIEDRVSVSKILAWLRAALTVHAPPPSCAETRLARKESKLRGSKTSDTYDDEDDDEMGNEHGASSSKLSADAFVFRRSPITFHGIADDVRIASHDDDAYHRNVEIRNCTNARIFVVAPVRFVTVVGCAHCTIFVAAASCVSSIANCEHVDVVVASKNVRILNLVDSVIHMYTPQRPVVMGDCRSIALAPHNVLRSARLSRIVRLAELSTKTTSSNRWSDPTYISRLARHPDRSLTKQSKKASTSELPAVDFIPFSVPGLTSNSTEAVAKRPSDRYLFPLPERYADAVRRRTAHLHSVRKEICSADFGDDKQGDIQSAIVGEFQAWLLRSPKHSSLLVSLMKQQARGNNPRGSGGAIN